MIDGQGKDVYKRQVWAVVICIAQVYVGLHYPLDVMGGGLLGGLIGLSMGTLCRHQMKEAT